MEEEGRIENPEDITYPDFRVLVKRIIDNFRIEHVIILMLIIVIVWALIDRQSLISMCNNYWVEKLEECYNPVSVTFP